MKRSIAHNIGYLISLALFIVAMVVLHYELKNYHFRDIVAELRAVRPVFLGFAVLLTFLDYLVLTAYDTLALRYIRHHLKYSKIVLASFIGYVFSHNMTIVGGSTARYRIYSALGVSAIEVAKLVIFCGLTFWLGFFAVGGIVFVSEPREVPAALHVPFVTVRPVGFIFVAVVVVYLILTALRRKPLMFREWEFSIPSVPVSAGQIAIASLDWLLACGVLYALLPTTAKLTYIEFLGIFMLAQAAGLLSYVPGGLGVFEAVMLLLLSDCMEKSSVISCLLLYRLIYYLLPFAAATTLLAIYELAAKKHSLQRLGVAFGKWSSAVTPHVLAVTSFIAGIILLLSGALPTEKGRLAWLMDLLPLAAIELSHFLGSIVGAGLLILARGLQRRVDAAYHATVTLLGLGIAFSLLKGFDYEEAIILAVMLLLFLPCRREFYRKASLIGERLTFTWAVLIIAVIVSSIWLGIFSYKHVEYSNQLWWRFAINGDAPRFIRATTGVVAMVLFYGVVKLLLPRAAEPLSTQPETMPAVEDIVRRSRKTYANLALLGDKSFLLSENRNCFIMYGIEGHSWIAMGDPVGPEGEWEPLVWKYRELCDHNEGWPVFYQIDKRNLDLYLDLGMTFLKLGEEARVSLKDFSLEGSSRKSLRSSYNKVERENCTFSIIPCDEVNHELDQLKHISDDWLKEKNTREKSFSIGSFEPDYIRKTPIAVVRKEGEIVSFANIWLGAEKEELSIDLMRHLSSTPNGIMDYMFVELMLWGKQQGYDWFSLGMAPMSGLENRELAPLWHKLGTFIFRHGEHFYNFQGLRQYKEKFDPVWESKYLACPRGLMLPRILANLATLISGGMKGVVAK
jgi:phosphatidylglycerol lysyltransferase